MGKEKLITQIKISHSLAASDCASVVFIIHKQKKTKCSSFVKLQKILNSDLRIWLQRWMTVLDSSKVTYKQTPITTRWESQPKILIFSSDYLQTNGGKPREKSQW